MNSINTNAFPKLCIHCYSTYTSKGERSLHDKTIEICPDCSLEEHINEERTIIGAGYARQLKSFTCPECGFYFLNDNFMEYQTQSIKIFYITRYNEIGQASAIGFKCPRCTTLSHPLNSRLKNIYEQNKIHSAIKFYLSPCPDCGESMLHEATDWLQYIIDNGAFYVKNISCKMRFICEDCRNEHIMKL